MDGLALERPTILSRLENAYFKRIHITISGAFINNLMSHKNQYTSNDAAQMISLVSSTKADSIDDFGRGAMLMTLSRLSNVRISDSDLRKLVDFFPHVSEMNLSLLLNIFFRETRDDMVPDMLWKTGAIDKLLSDIQIPINSAQSAINVISIFSLLLIAAVFHAQTHEQVVKQCVYQQALSCYLKLLQTNFKIDMGYVTILASSLEFYYASTDAAFDGYFVKWVVEQCLPQMTHDLMRKHILAFFEKSAKRAQTLVTPHIETILSTIVSWLLCDDPSQTLALIDVLLNLATRENIRYFIDALHGYERVKSCLLSENIGLIACSLSIINQLRDEPEIIEDLLSDGKMVSVLHQLSQSKNSDIQRQAEELFIQQNLICAQHYQKEGKYHEALSLYKKIIQSPFASTRPQCAAHLGCAKIYEKWFINNQNNQGHYMDASKHYQDLIKLDPNYVDENQNNITKVLEELKENHLAYLEASRPHAQVSSKAGPGFLFTPPPQKMVVIPQSSGDESFDAANQLR